MDEKPKSIWKKSWTGRSWLWAWLVLVLATFLIVLIISLFIPGRARDTSIWEAALNCSLGVGVIGGICVGLLVFIRWIFHWQNIKRFLFGLACFATLLALIYAEEDWRGWHAWNKFKHEWEAKGEKFDYASVVPPPVPDDQNFAMAPIWAESVKATLGPERARQWKYPDDGRTNFTDRMPTLWRNDDNSDSLTSGEWAKGMFTDLKLWQAYYRAPNRNTAFTTNDFPTAPQPQMPAQDVLLALSKYDSAIEELRQASRLPYSRFPLGYDSENPGIILLPHLSLLKRSALVLELRAIAELQNGQSEKALDDVKLMLRLTDAIRTEPFWISQMVRIAMLQITLQPIYEGLAEHKWSDAQLSEMDAELVKLNFVADYYLVMRGEMGYQDSLFGYLRHHPKELYNLSGDFGGERHLPLPSRIFIHLIPSGWFYQNQLHCARPMVELYLPVMDASQQTISPGKVKKADATITAQTRRLNPFNVTERMMMLPSLGNAASRFAHAQASADLARVAIALERYRLAHGDYPESLDALAPQFMEKIPHDIIGGGPLHYRRTNDGQFVLYSVGWNEKDDGGVVVFAKGSTPSVDINQGDWVWRYPKRE